MKIIFIRVDEKNYVATANTKHGKRFFRLEIIPIGVNGSGRAMSLKVRKSEDLHWSAIGFCFWFQDDNYMGYKSISGGSVDNTLWNDRKMSTYVPDLDAIFKRANEILDALGYLD